MAVAALHMRSGDRVRRRIQDARHESDGTVICLDGHGWILVDWGEGLCRWYTPGEIVRVGE